MMLFSKSVTPRQLDLALLVLRMGAGLSMAAHGYQKVFGAGFAGVTQGFDGMGIPLPAVVAPLVALLELLGGLAIAAGFLTRPIALLLVCNMVAAMLLVHLKHGFFAPDGIELTFLFAVSHLALVFAGPGSWSVDAAIGKNRR